MHKKLKNYLKVSQTNLPNIRFLLLDNGVFHKDI